MRTESAPFPTGYQEIWREKAATCCGSSASANSDGCGCATTDSKFDYFEGWKVALGHVLDNLLPGCVPLSAVKGYKYLPKQPNDYWQDGPLPICSHGKIRQYGVLYPTAFEPAWGEQCLVPCAGGLPSTCVSAKLSNGQGQGTLHYTWACCGDCSDVHCASAALECDFGTLTHSP